MGRCKKKEVNNPKADLVRELHKPARKVYPRRRVIVKGLDDLWQADLAEFQLYARENKGYKYILVVIDCFSKYLWTRAIKNKTGAEVTKAFTDIFNQGRIPQNLQTDNGTEFYNQSLQDLMKKHNINHYSTFSTLKASIAERSIRTLKEKLYRVFSMNGSYKYLNLLQNVTDEYNNTRHRTIGMQPSRVNKANERDLLNTVYSHIKIAGKQKYHVGDIVRISKQKALFDKGYTPNWTTELFKISKIKISLPTVYYLQDMKGVDIRGTFYEQELQKVKHADLYLVEKILKRKGNQVFVQWLGMDKSNNSWINKNAVL